MKDALSVHGIHVWIPCILDWDRRRGVRASPRTRLRAVGAAQRHDVEVSLRWAWWSIRRRTPLIFVAGAWLWSWRWTPTAVTVAPAFGRAATISSACSLFVRVGAKPPHHASCGHARWSTSEHHPDMIRCMASCWRVRLRDAVRFAAAARFGLCSRCTRRAGEARALSKSAVLVIPHSCLTQRTVMRCRTVEYRF